MTVYAKVFKNIRRILFSVFIIIAFSAPVFGEEEIVETVVQSTPVPQSYIFSGAATSKIPIIVPPGRGGIAPNLFLTYNSYRKNGWIGVGWDLDLGAIQRSTRHSVDYTANDFVATSNGSTSELVSRVSEWGTNYYGAKIEGAFSKYYFNPSSEGWEVTTKDGKIYYYGTNSDSRQENSNGVFKWCLDRVEDANGNYMTVSYTKDQGQIYLSEIHYTGNTAGIGTSNYVKFYLDGRTDAPPKYDTHSNVVTAKWLKTIEIRSQSNLVRAYTLAYATNSTTSRSVLAGVQQFGSDATLDGSGNVISGSALPASSFTYLNPGNGLESATEWANNMSIGGNGYHGLLDFNGDGRKDWWYVVAGTNQLRVRLSTDSSFGSDTQWANENWLGVGWFGFNDINADGKPDLWYVMQGSEWPPMKQLMVRISTGSSFKPATQWANYIGNGSVGYCGFLDFNGDGCDDWWQVYETRLCVSLSTGSSLEPFSIWANENWKGAGWFGFNDVNGDGFRDLWYVVNGTSQLRVRLSTGSSFEPSTEWADNMSIGGVGYHGFLDFNGDGLHDWWYVVAGTNQLRVRLSTGSSLEPETQWANENWGGAGWFGFDDLNSDGHLDLWYTIIGTYQLRVRLSTGSSFEPATEWANETAAGSGWFGFSDADGNGKPDYWYVPSGTSRVMVRKTMWDPPDLLSTTSNGSGGIFSLQYTPSSSYQNILLPFIVQTASSITANDGFGNQYPTGYSYYGGFYDYVNREFRGFKTATQTNPDGTTLKTKFYQGNPDDPEDSYFFKGRQDWVEFSEPNEGPLITKTDFSWTTYPESPSEDSWAFVKLNQKRIESYDDVTVYTQEVYTYDNNNGTLLTTVTTGTDYDGTEAEAITKTNQYVNYGDWLWRLTQETVEGSTSGKVRESFYGYETGTGNLLSKEFWLNTGTNPSVTYTYDTYGNMLTETDARGNATTTEYDTATYTYPVKITYPTTNGVTHIVEMDWDYRYGKKTWIKDENSNYTYYDYDEFGRSIQVDFPDGGQATAEYFDDVFPRYVISKVKEDASGNTIDKYEYFDGLGRTIQTITFGEDDKSIVTKMSYDEMGRNDKVEGPFFSTGTGYPKTPPTEYPWVETAYDYRGRPIEVESPDGQYGTIVSSMSYSGFSTTATDPDGSQKTERKDYLGRLRQVIEYAEAGQQNTYYTYNAAGDLLTVTDHLGNVTTINYDTLGRKINMTDPDMGYWVYTYDANGNLLTQTDAMDQIITFAYDELNRVTSKTYSTADPTVTYTYDNLAISNGRGRLYSTSNTQVTSTVNGYDVMGRETSVSKTIAGGSTYTTEYSYDLSGKLISTVYPDSYQVNYEYIAKTGLLQQVVGVTDFTTYAIISDYQSSGKIGTMDFGNNTSHTYTYDPESQRMTGFVTQDPSQLPENDIQRRTYQYTSAGDISDISDEITGVGYHYEYDYLHRLVSETTTGSAEPLELQVLDFSYNQGDPVHSPSSINTFGDDYTTTYDANGNTTGGYDFTNPSQPQTRTITYNADNMPTQITRGTDTVTFIYDGNGTRAKKTIEGGSTTYYVGEHYEVINGSAIKYIFAGNLRIAMVSTAGTSYFHKDHLGSSTVMTDATGLTVETSEYMPFGHMRAHTGTAQTNYKFTDQELDSELGLYNYGARLYDPMIGIFVSADTIVPDFSNPQTLNRYSYCYNNPLLYTDPTGHWGISNLVGAVVGAVVGGVTAAVTGGDIWQGIATGAISGAVFSFAGDYISAYNSVAANAAMEAYVPTMSAGAQAGIHGVAGAVSGGINSAITGGDVGMGMLTGGISGGIANYAGGYLPGGFGYQFAGQSAIGGVTGGISSELYGGSFSDGFIFGIQTAAIGYSCNTFIHRYKFRLKDARPDEYTMADVIANGVDKVVNAPDGQIKVWDGSAYRVINKNGYNISYSAAKVSLTAYYSIGRNRVVTINNIRGKGLLLTPKQVVLSSTERGVVEVNAKFRFFSKRLRYE